MAGTEPRRGTAKSGASLRKVQNAGLALFVIGFLILGGMKIHEKMKAADAAEDKE